ncbi:MAG: terminase family protein [Pseudomonadota bacterium]
MITIIDACQDPKLFGPWFRKRASWAAWFVFLKALFALPMDAQELSVFHQLTGLSEPPTAQAAEAWLVIGRRGGKSFIVALIAVFLATFRDYAQHLAPGERGTVMVIAADRKQARVIMRYVKGLLEGVPMLRRLIVAQRGEAIELSNRIDIEIHTGSFRAVRGYTVVAALLDEVAFWRSDESANPDREIVNALRPAMATIPDALLIGLSSPYARRGVLYEAYSQHFGKPGDVLVVQAESRTMNPSLPQSVVDRAYAEDPASAAAEYGAQFRSDVEGFLQPEWLDRATVPGISELPPVAGVDYYAFADPSGGAADSFTLGIAHREAERLILDLCRGRRPPFDPQAVTADYADVLRRYGCHRVIGDRYGAEWVVSAFRDVGISYDPAELPKSDIYLNAEPLFATGAAQLLDQRQLLTELRQLERRTGSGKDRIDHPPRGHDDHANAACGALWLAARQRGEVDMNDAYVTTPEDVQETVDEHMQQLEADTRRPWDY